MHEEIRPPNWALAHARRLSLAEFGASFLLHWGQVRHGIVKSECWQTYQEPETRSWQEYRRANYGAVLGLLEEEADGDQPVYDAAVKNDTPFVRLRVVQLPLSEYLAFEMWNYVVRAGRGETIEVALVPSDDQRQLPDHRHFDFLLFDGSAALVHDYGTDGLQIGGWETTAPAPLRRLTEIADCIRRRAVPLDVFLERQKLTFPPD